MATLPADPGAETLSTMAAPPPTLAAAFVESLERHASRDAIRPPDGLPITYAELGQRVRIAVAVLRDLRRGRPA